VTTINAGGERRLPDECFSRSGSLRFSHANPPDFPGWFNYTPVFTGSARLPEWLLRFRVDGTRCEVELRDASK